MKAIKLHPRNFQYIVEETNPAITVETLEIEYNLLLSSNKLFHEDREVYLVYYEQIQYPHVVRSDHFDQIYSTNDVTGSIEIEFVEVQSA